MMLTTASGISSSGNPNIDMAATLWTWSIDVPLVSVIASEAKPIQGHGASESWIRSR